MCEPVSPSVASEIVPVLKEVIVQPDPDVDSVYVNESSGSEAVIATFAARVLSAKRTLYWLTDSTSSTATSDGDVKSAITWEMVPPTTHVESSKRVIQFDNEPAVHGVFAMAMRSQGIALPSTKSEEVELTTRDIVMSEPLTFGVTTTPAITEFTMVIYGESGATGVGIVTVIVTVFESVA